MLEITRDVIQQREVRSELLEGNIGYVRLAGFSDASAAQLEDEIRKHLDAGSKKLILDLRGNPGGYVTAARDIASEFIADGVLFYEEDATGDQVATDAVPGGIATDPSITLVVLIDEGSASASEIVAGALQGSRAGDAGGRDELRQGHRPAVAGAAGRGRRVPPHGRPLAHPRQDVDPRRRHQPRRRRDRPRGRCPPTPTRSWTARWRC